MTAEPPIWLLDVDGVLNATRPGWSAAPRRGTAWAHGAGWTMRWAPALLTRIRAAHTAGTAEIRWCTTWCEFSSQLERLFSLPPLPLAAPSIPPGTAGWKAKQQAAYDVLAGGRRLIWTDDEAIPPDELLKAAEPEGRALLIRPVSRRGLQPADLDAVEAFADASGGASSPPRLP